MMSYFTTSAQSTTANLTNQPLKPTTTSHSYSLILRMEEFSTAIALTLALMFWMPLSTMWTITVRSAYGMSIPLAVGIVPLSLGLQPNLEPTTTFQGISFL